jgi:hypothetical protein
MSDAVSFAEIEGQRLEMLPPRTVMSMSTSDGSTGTDLGKTLTSAVCSQLSSLQSTPGIGSLLSAICKGT